MSGAAHRSIWQRRLVDPVVAQLRQGITPDRIALTLALATVLGVFPILGATTFLCALAAIWLRLNQPVMQLANYLLTPLHVALLLPFYRAGETLFGQAHVPIFSVGELLARFQTDPLQFVVDYGRVALYGICVWALLAPFAAALLYLTLRPALRQLARRVKAA
ncbi:DUF2062 domain-containing protein [Solimonas flava]|uniref:DUF2062 domain-containing protein n=1 Tax=Solimonas flava TaxID=415849 RepID=UPI00040C4572|nr:DUF2062 domain-containing protein [Solimonas flava]